MSSYTVNSLKRWSCLESTELPETSKIKSIHVYDFDNTLFSTPLPNKQLWNSESIQKLQSQDVFLNGGWWHEPQILSGTGDGVDVEETRGWRGWWNEEIVELVKLSMEQDDALAVLLTGRKESRFADIIKRMVSSRGLKFDIMCLKPEVGPQNQRFSNTLKFKQAFLEDVVQTYSEAQDIRIYEDRLPHVRQFRQFFLDLNEGFTRQRAFSHRKSHIKAEVIEVPENATRLAPEREAEIIQQLINTHNMACRDGKAAANASPKCIMKNVYYTGYLVSPTDTDRLLAAANLPSTTTADGEIRTLANNVMITPRPAPKQILEKVGGIGYKVRWRATATGTYDNKVWAMKVHPVPGSTVIHTETSTPCVVLALRRTARPHESHRIKNWNSLASDKSFEFETTVGEKAQLRLENERLANGFPVGGTNVAGMDDPKRSAMTESDFPPLGKVTNHKQGFHANNSNRKPPSGPRNGDAGHRGARGGQRNKHFDGKGGGRGGRQQGRPRRVYRSLDDQMAAKSAGGGASNGMPLGGAGGDGGLAY